MLPSSIQPRSQGRIQRWGGRGSSPPTAGNLMETPPKSPLYVSGTALGSLKQPGKTHKNAKRELIHEPKNARTKQPHPWWPPRPAGAARLNTPSDEVRLARGLNAPSSEIRLTRGLSVPRPSASLEDPRAHDTPLLLPRPSI
jgi:hypothetical protein